MRHKRILIGCLKYGVTAALVAWVVRDAVSHDKFSELIEQPKDWGLLAAAWGVCMAGVCATFLRWYLLVRALALPFRLRDAFRLGFLGYLLNFVSLGSVGGDLFKAVFIAREQPGRRTEAVATVVVDRVFGLYGLLIVATVAILITGQHRSPAPVIRLVSHATLIFTGLGAIAIIALLTPGFTKGALSEFLSGLPKVGSHVSRLITAIRIYRSRPLTVVVAGLMSVGVHVMFVVGIGLIAQGLPGRSPTLGRHFVAVPLALVASALPLPLGSLGAFEKMFDFLYFHVAGAAEGQGILVAVGFRVVTVLIALVGMGYYLTSRREVAELMHAAESELDADQTGQSGDAEFVKTDRRLDVDQVSRRGAEARR